MADAPDFHDYMRAQLIQYIKEEQKKGFTLEEIEKVLLEVGHHKNVIQECFDELKKEDAGKDVEVPKEELKKDLVTDVKSSIQNFFGQLQGAKAVKEAKSEATPAEEREIIEEAVEDVKSEKRTFIFEGIVFFIYLVALVALVLFTSGSTGDDFIVVAIGFSASFLNTFISFAAMNFATNVPIYVFIPVIVAGIFYALGTFAHIEVFSHMDMETLGIINVFISMIFNILVINVAFLKPKVEEPEEEEKPEPKETKEQVHSSPPPKPRVKHEHIEALRKDFK